MTKLTDEKKKKIRVIQIKPDHEDLQMDFKILLKWKTNLTANDCKIMDVGINNLNCMNTVMNLKLATITQERYL